MIQFCEVSHLKTSRGCRSNLRHGLQVEQRQLPDLLQEGVQIGRLALAELSLLSGELGPAGRLLPGLLGRLLGQTHHLLHQLAAK